MLVLAFLPVDGRLNSENSDHNHAHNSLSSSAGNEIQAMAQRQKHQQDSAGDVSYSIGNPNHVRPHETLIRGYQRMHLRDPSSCVTKIDPVQSHPQPKTHEIPAFFVFGNSLVDSGNQQLPGGSVTDGLSQIS